MTDPRTIDAIEASDTDQLVRIVDGHVGGRSWDALVGLGDLCLQAVTRGKQLWGVAEYVRFRLALDAPAEWAGPAVSAGRTRFTLGPLSEVAASTKAWDALEPFLAPGPERALTAHERVVRGEDLEDATIDPLVMELPLTLTGWEPRYQTATYWSDRVESATPPRPKPSAESLGSPGPIVDDTEGCRALMALVDHWVDTSNGRAQTVCVEGSAVSAVAALGLERAALAPVEPSLAMAWMAWAAATGGAHGRRRGAAAGRFSAWWAAHELAGLEWPVEAGRLGDAIEKLEWFLWSDGSPDTGWSLRLAVESPAEAISWALSAVDAE